MSKIVFAAVLGAFVSALLVRADAQLRKAPELAFTVPSEGDKLLSQYRGKVVALEFILTTCPHCQAASRLMSNFQREYGSRGFQALDVAIDALDGRSPAQAAQVVQVFANQFQVAFPVGFTTRDQMMTFMGFNLADRFVVPQLVLIDRKGMIHYQTPATENDQHDNDMKDNVIKQRIEELLALPAAATATHTTKSRATTKKST